MKMALNYTDEQQDNGTINILLLTSSLSNYMMNVTTTSMYIDVASPPVPIMEIVTIVIYILVCVFGVIGNFIALAVVICHASMRTASNIFIFNLALSDFLFLLSLPFTVVVIIRKEWLFGEAMCKIHFGCFGITLFTGVYTIALMSLDRYVAVCKNKWHRYRTMTNSIMCCLAVWVASILLMLPLLLYSKHDEEYNACFLDFPQYGDEDEENIAPGFIIYTMTLGFFIPVILISLFYMLILARLRRHSAQSQQTLEKNKKRTRRVTLLVLGIILGYLVCWLPYWIMQIYVLSKGKDAMMSVTAMRIYHVASILYHINSLLNPILYGFLSVSFRKGVIALLRCKARFKSSIRRHSKSNSMLANRSIHSDSMKRKASPVQPLDTQDEQKNFLTVDKCYNTCMSKQSVTTTALTSSRNCMDEEWHDDER